MQSIHVKEFAENNHIKFGTSGIRALNSALTDKVCFVFTYAFLQYLESTEQIQPGQCIILAGDLRSNTEKMLQAIAMAILSKGYNYEYNGKIPTPALCYYSMQKQSPGIMVTGSHIPENMNGMKFYKAGGEILKTDEKIILSQVLQVDEKLLNGKTIELTRVNDAYDVYVNRYLNFFPNRALDSLNLGIYAHSSVATHILKDILQGLGANVTIFGDNDNFYGMDTEALSDNDIKMARDNLNTFRLDAIVSTDGDGDRPLLTDEHGEWLHGDIIGMLTAIILQAKQVVIPISCNNSVTHIPDFEAVYKTRIGSPYVVEKMNQLLQAGKTQIIGYEANGGVLIGSEFTMDDRTLSPLPTRDSIIPLLCILFHMKKVKTQLSTLVNDYCQFFTASNSVKDIPSTQIQELFDLLTAAVIPDFFQIKVKVEKIDLLDGLRIYLSNAEIIHLRASGNAPELRCYTESQSKLAAKKLNDHCMHIIKQWSMTHA